MSSDEEEIWEFYSDDEEDFKDPMVNTVVEYDDFLESLLNRSAADSANDDDHCDPGVPDLGDILDESNEPLLCAEDLLNDYEDQHEYDLCNELQDLPDLEPSSDELLICGEDYGTLDLNDLEEDGEYLLLKDYEGYAEFDEVQDPCHLNGSDEYLLCYDGSAEQSVEYEYWYPAQDVPFASEESPFFDELREITNYDDAAVDLYEELLCQQFMEKLNVVVSTPPKKCAASKDLPTPECRRAAGDDGATQSSSAAGSSKSSSSLNVEAAEFVPSVSATIAAVACDEVLKDNGIENSSATSVKPHASSIARSFSEEDGQSTDAEALSLQPD